MGSRYGGPICAGVQPMGDWSDAMSELDRDLKGTWLGPPLDADRDRVWDLVWTLSGPTMGPRFEKTASNPLRNLFPFCFPKRLNRLRQTVEPKTIPYSIRARSHIPRQRLR